jgi:hypothetical protein
MSISHGNDHAEVVALINSAGMSSARAAYRSLIDPLYRSFAAEVNREAYMLELEELDHATGLGLAETALLTKALSPPRTNAATPAIIITRKVPRLRGCWLRLVDADIFLRYQ